MSQFMFLAVLLVLIALAFAVSALWQRSRKLAIVLAVALPLGAGALYLWRGEPAALDPAKLAAPTELPADFASAVALLEQRVHDKPGDPETLLMLARTFLAGGQYEKARERYVQVLQLEPGRPDATAEYVETLLRTSKDRRFPPAAGALLQVALDKDPSNQRALFYAGLYEAQEGRHAQAAAIWERLLPLLDPATATALRPQIDKARELSGQSPLPPPARVLTLQIEVAVNPTLEAAAKRPDAVLFVFANRVRGGGPPLAVKRVQPTGTWPIKVMLSDTDAPMSQEWMSSQSQVTLGARLTFTGNAMPGKGDLEATPVRVPVMDGHQSRLVLNTVVP